MNNHERHVGKDASTGAYFEDEAAERYARQLEEKKQKDDKEMEAAFEDYKKEKEVPQEQTGIKDPEEESTG